MWYSSTQSVFWAMLIGVFQKGGCWCLKYVFCSGNHIEADMVEVVLKCVWLYFIFTEYVVKLGFLIIVFGKCSCRKSIQEWGKRLNFSSCTFTKCELFAWLLLYYWSLGCEYTVQEFLFVCLWGLFWEILSQINLKWLFLTFEMQKLCALNHPCSTHFVNLRCSILCLLLNVWRKC